MKSLTMNLMLATVAWMVGSTAAMAADLKFNIPFTFEVAGKTMTPGIYRLQSSNNEVQFRLSNEQTHDGLYVNSQSPHDPEKEWKTRQGGVMQFACGDSGCVLTQVWTNKGMPAVKFPSSHAKGEFSRVALIRAAGSK